jgi:GH25 family lysozyme M1 (1,4-beta-N-acetylmuramidase)
VGAVHRYDRHYSAEGQFANFQAAVKGCEMKLAPAVYVVPDNPYDLKIKRLDVLLQLMEQSYGVKPLIMCTPEAYLKYFSLERYASYHVIIVSNGLQFPATRYSIWQYTDKEQVPGIIGYVPGLKLHPTYKIDNLKVK